MSDLTNRLRVLAIGADCTFTAHVALREAANELDQCNARIEALQNECYASNAEVIVLTAEVQQLRQYLDTAQRRALSLREQLTLAESVRASQAAGLTEGLERLRADAARYVYLRDVAWHSGSLIFYAERYGPEDWDAHIDAARATLKGEA